MVLHRSGLCEENVLFVRTLELGQLSQTGPSAQISLCWWRRSPIASNKEALFIYNGDAFASTEAYQEIHIPQLILVSLQPLSQQGMLSWKSPAPYPQPCLGC